MIPKPKNPSYPAPGKTNLYPVLKPLPLLNQTGAGYFKRLKQLFIRRNYILVEDFFLYTELLDGWLYIPRNFVYDNASIPFWLRGFSSPDGPLLFGSIPHDFGCRFGCVLFASYNGGPFEVRDLEKEDIDKLFRTLNDRQNELYIFNSLAYCAVRIGGFFSYRPQDIYEVDWSIQVVR